MLTRFEYPPPIFKGGTEQQLLQNRRYLFSLVEHLNLLLDAMPKQGNGDNAVIRTELEKKIAELRKEIDSINRKLAHIAGGGSGTVTSVNDVLPDAFGNVQLAPGDVGAVDEDEELTILEVIEMWNNS